MATAADDKAVIPGLTRDPATASDRARDWIAGQARNDKDGARDDDGGDRDDNAAARNDNLCVRMTPKAPTHD